MGHSWLLRFGLIYELPVPWEVEWSFVAEHLGVFCVLERQLFPGDDMAAFESEVHLLDLYTCKQIDGCEQV
jgi:hypothetical protein